MKKNLMLVFLLSLSISGYGQVRMYVKCFHVGYNVGDTNRSYDLHETLHYDNPRLKLDIVIENSSQDTIRLNTGYTFMAGKIRYKIGKEDIILEDAGWLSSEDQIPIFYQNIPPKDNYDFSLSFELTPRKYFKISNYLHNVWDVISTLEVTINQEKPQFLVLKSEPIVWHSVSVCNEQQKK